MIRSGGPVPVKPGEPFKSPELEEEAAGFVQNVGHPLEPSGRGAKGAGAPARGLLGICVECGDAISPKRLAAVPWAERRLGCQSRLEQRKALGKCA